MKTRWIGFVAAAILLAGVVGAGQMGRHKPSVRRTAPAQPKRQAVAVSAPEAVAGRLEEVERRDHTASADVSLAPEPIVEPDQSDPASVMNEGPVDNEPLFIGGIRGIRDSGMVESSEALDLRKTSGSSQKGR